MRIDKAIYILKPRQHLSALHTRRSFGQDCAVRRIRPIAKVFYKAVLLRVEMDVGNQLRKVGIRRHGDSMKRMLEQTPRPVVFLVNGLGVSVEQIRERLAGCGDRQIWKLAVGLAGFDAHKQVKMVAHKAVGKGLGDGIDVADIQLQEQIIVARLRKQIATIHTAVVDVIVAIGL